ncbi:hypothetical protein CK215_11990 [Mesorhizobium sp. WSM3864]|nr:hypothetical protein CK215_11990 [Mesorhizobium sp. WSM3864]
MLIQSEALRQKRRAASHQHVIAGRKEDAQGSAAPCSRAGRVSGTACPTPPFTTMALADDIQMAERHVLQAEQHIKRQRARIAALKRRRLPRGKASSFLQLLEDAQSMHLHQLSLLLERASRERTRAGIRLLVQRRQPTEALFVDRP